ncbi:PTS system cellobiose-specific IIC component [Breznakia sp. PF5-3]|uniref:PTS sugar transporter subunit IIC n=1 Tax=unclassified Breznakia TaxID=2623764 RepID=UPI002405C212|nr:MULTISPECIES: PTS transporter subunit EIIC [unclassified Breznakia]MDF9824633.1 PTS system cellobiose-specific IIC component [Breznakia sp. PM6-1]MDF9835569.1 PTS system cellobiose-specific IIC component [Breznakia sp. PF5-3]MDF9838687.1 PTS system cellobiose-specific IIC component [Breznakia sp. PFB2-8]MDF9860718.1 PTS system cellobiose-specific IIC component [Breznakia sp. PH5-24]
MKSFTNWMEQHFVPVAAKIGSQKHLVAIRDAFIAIMPVTMAGAVATLLNVFFRDLPNEWWGLENSFVSSDIVSGIIGVNGNVWWGTLAIISLVFIFALGYYIAKAYKAPALAGGVIAVAAFIAVTPQAITVVSEAGEEIGAWGHINYTYLNSSGLFTALIVGLLASIVYSKLINANITIKLPDSVPPAVSKAFTAIIPGLISIYLCAIIAYLINLGTGKAIGDLILEYIQQPFLSLSQGFGAVIIVIIAVQLFWFFGIHGTNVLAPVLDGVYLTATNSNNAAYTAGTAVSELPYLWTRGSFDAYVWMGGAGCTIALIIAIFIFSKKDDARAIAKLSAPMGAFNINEPVMFGMPIVLNPIYFIPWMIVPVILTIIAYAATAMGVVPPVFTPVPWVMPPIIYAFLATGGSIAAAILALINLVIAVVIWGAFVLIGNKVELEEADAE